VFDIQLNKMQFWFKIFTIFSILLNSEFGFGQISLDNFNKEFSQNPKPILLYFSTDWCAYCKIQDREFDKNIELINSLSEKYYFIKLDGESLDDFIFLENKYSSNSNEIKKSTHDFVKVFLSVNEQETYPFWIVLNQNLEIIGKEFGFLDQNKLKKLYQIEIK